MVHETRDRRFIYNCMVYVCVCGGEGVEEGNLSGCYVGGGRGGLCEGNGDCFFPPSQVRVHCASHVFKGDNDPTPLNLMNTSQRFSTLTLLKSVLLGVMLRSAPQ